MSSSATTASGGAAASPIVIGDLLVDELVDEGPTGRRTVRYAGGAGLNVAVDLVALGGSALLVAEVADDAAGAHLRRVARARGVDLHCVGDPDATGWATSERVNGEPRYAFRGAVCDRTLRIDDDLDAHLGAERPVVVTTFPFDDAAQVDALLGWIIRRGHRLVLDPNPRPGLIRDHGEFVRGFLRLAAAAVVVKVGQDDLALLGLTATDEWWPSLHASGVIALVVTEGAAGLRMVPGSGPVTRIAVPAGARAVDTMGAGDAVTAVLAHTVARTLHPSPDDVAAALRDAVAFAADIVMAPGGHVDARPLPGW